VPRFGAHYRPAGPQPAGERLVGRR
jgi:hypothetical protein